MNRLLLARLSAKTLRRSSSSRFPLLFENPRFLSTAPPAASVTTPNVVHAEGNGTDHRVARPDAPNNIDPPSSAVDQSQIADLTTFENINVVTDAVPATDVATIGADIASSSFSLSDALLQPAVSLLHMTHDATNLPWYLAIAASTVMIRTLLLPATIMTMKNSARMQAIQPDMMEKREVVMQAIKTGNRPLANTKQKELQEFMKNAGVAPAKVLIGPLAQFPVFISFFVSIRRLSQSDPSFVDGGAAWFTDLSVMDPTYALPVVCAATLLGMTELGGDTGSTKMTPQMRTGMRAVAGLSLPLTYWFPAAVFCYWIPNNLFSMALGVAMRTENIRRAIGLHVDPAFIPGTRAWKEREAKMAVLARQAGLSKETNVEQVLASYGKQPTTRSDGTIAKPVLFKQKPKKKINVATN
ncbi:unnamed protein product [Agarophyton chilense]